MAISGHIVSPSSGRYRLSGISLADRASGSAYPIGCVSVCDADVLCRKTLKWIELVFDASVITTEESYFVLLGIRICQRKARPPSWRWSVGLRKFLVFRCATVSHSSSC